MQKITPCLWFNGNAEDAASFYVTLLPNSRIDRIFRSPADTPSGPAGSVLTVEFTLAGMQYVGLNGGPEFKSTKQYPFRSIVTISRRSIDYGQVCSMAGKRLHAVGSRTDGDWLGK